MEIFHSWDTETIDIDPKKQTPVGNGKIICFSCFVGPDINFGNGPSKWCLIKSGLFIDNYAECEGLVNEFKEYMENENYLKVWHNYGYDRHLFYNHGINVK